MTSEDLKPKDVMQKFVKGKHKITIKEFDFFITMPTKERLEVLAYFQAMAKGKNFVKESNSILNIFRNAFRNEYSTLEPKLVNDFVDSNFEDILLEFASDCGWVDKEKLKQMQNQLINKEWLGYERLGTIC